MVRLKDFELIPQRGAYDCWICCASMIYNYLDKASIEAGNDLNQKLEHHRLLDIDVNTVKAGSAVDLLYNFCLSEGERVFSSFWISVDSGSKQITAVFNEFEMYIFSTAIPTINEILEELRLGHPLLSCIGDKELPEGKSCVEDYKEGHWVIIIGYDETNSELIIADPAYADFTRINYDRVICTNYGNTTFYWENTSYLNECWQNEQLRANVIYS